MDRFSLSTSEGISQAATGSQTSPDNPFLLCRRPQLWCFVAAA